MNERRCTHADITQVCSQLSGRKMQEERYFCLLFHDRRYRLNDPGCLLIDKEGVEEE